MDSIGMCYCANICCIFKEFQGHSRHFKAFRGMFICGPCFFAKGKAHCVCPTEPPAWDAQRGVWRLWTAH